MNSIVLKLQEDSTNPSISVLTLLRQALRVAKKLKIDNFQLWINQELNGYAQRRDLPKYRFVTGLLEALNPVYGWQPVSADSYEGTEILKIVSEQAILQPISELQDLVKNRNSSYLEVYFPPRAKATVMSMLNHQAHVRLKLSCSEVQGILEKVRDIILNWSLQLEEDGILGEKLTFSLEEKLLAKQQDYSLPLTISIQQFQSQESLLSHNSTKMNMQAGRDITGSVVNSDVSGVVTVGNVSGTVTNAIEKLRTSNNSELADKLVQLQAVIEEEPELNPEDKQAALEEVVALAEAGQNPKEGAMQKVAKTSMRTLKGIAAELPTAVKLVHGVNELLPEIAQFFG